MFSRNILHSSTRLPPRHLSSWHRSLATATNESLSPLSTVPPATTQEKKKGPRAQISTAVLLNRSPLITRSLSPFEEAYYAYQARIRRALHNPFPSEFYFKQGSLLETRFSLEEMERERIAFGDDFVHDEAAGSEKAAADRAAALQLAEQEGEGEQLLPRETPSEVNADFHSLDRQGERNLYLLLKVKDKAAEVWRFPQGGVQSGDLLHQAAQKDLYAECGENMDTWIVSRNPVGIYKPSEPSPTASKPSDHIVFFFKAHIMAGQVQPPSSHVKDFAWLTKEEIKPLVNSEYWDGVKDMLSDY